VIKPFWLVLPDSINLNIYAADGAGGRKRLRIAHQVAFAPSVPGALEVGTPATSSGNVIQITGIEMNPDRIRVAVKEGLLAASGGGRYL
jgi:hypothetical protein